MSDLSLSPEQSVARWLDRWVLAIRARDPAMGRDQFDPQVYSFGTRAVAVNGIVDLVNQQWSEVWPSTRGFTVDQREIRFSQDETMAILMLRWHSYRDEPGHPSDRREGRATIVLVSENRQDWRAIHTHFSLNP